MTRLILPLRPPENLFLIVSISSFTRRGDGPVGISLRQGAGCKRDDKTKRFFCASLKSDERISSHSAVIIRDNEALYPGGVINSV
jgi:hypothetical protein